MQHQCIHSLQCNNKPMRNINTAYILQCNNNALHCTFPCPCNCTVPLCISMPMQQLHCPRYVTAVVVSRSKQQTIQTNEADELAPPVLWNKWRRPGSAAMKWNERNETKSSKTTNTKTKLLSGSSLASCNSLYDYGPVGGRLTKTELLPRRANPPVR